MGWKLKQRNGDIVMVRADKRSSWRSRASGTLLGSRAGVSGPSFYAIAVSGGITLNAKTIAWRDQAIALGATPPQGTIDAVDAFFTSFDSAGFLAADFDYMYLMIGEASGDTSTNKYNQKRVNLIAPGTFDATVVNPYSSGHTATGTAGDKSMNWQTGAKQSTIPDRSVSASMGIVCTALNDNSLCTEHAFFVSHYNRCQYSSVKWGCYGTDFAGAEAQSVPSMLYVLADGTGQYTYENATLQVTNASVPTDVPDVQATIFSMSLPDNTPIQQTDATLAFAWHGRGFDAGERTAWYTMVQSLMSAFGVTI